MLLITEVISNRHVFTAKHSCVYMLRGRRQLFSWSSRDLQLWGPLGWGEGSRVWGKDWYMSFLLPLWLQHCLVPTSILSETNFFPNQHSLPPHSFHCSSSPPQHAWCQTRLNCTGTKDIWGEGRGEGGRIHQFQVEFINQNADGSISETIQILQAGYQKHFYFVLILTFCFSALCRNLLSLLLLTTARFAEFILQNSWAFSMETCSLLM